ncbi:DUF3775 domain-containing protein [Histidinibacterium aquaticum]|uniref:DUF3775 domain-containing protein n=1 Tax=Histidinibacterium aquaticum TaxID=2613962 RepID=A0A5J5GDB0_9RHOB|nr:DUF3775 domain-containing protein [Histidinibacterium aquaticum]KAA9006051.1 DUF3775 domain-containing protein [Histidinibacterium aquaticum]
MLQISASTIAEIAILARDERRGEAQLRAFVERLSEEKQAALVAVFWIGRGSYDAEDLEEAQETALSEATTPTADYLLGSPHLADHLESGMEALGLDPSEEEEALY